MENRVVLAVDPGIRACGAALFAADGVLWKAALVRCSTDVSVPAPARCEAMAWEASQWGGVDREVLALEWPQVYRAGRGKRGADPNDLLLLAGVCGALAAHVRCDVVAVLPREWKGTLPKEIACAHVYARLAPGERKVVDALGLPKSSIHHVLDAVGIGLHVVGRGLRS